MCLLVCVFTVQVASLLSTLHVHCTLLDSTHRIRDHTEDGLRAEARARVHYVQCDRGVRLEHVVPRHAYTGEEQRTENTL